MDKMDWYKIAQAEGAGYPYYLAIYFEGRFKGQYPNEITYVPEMKKMWDSGKLGNGKKMTELKDNKPSGLITKLRNAGKDPKFDQVDFYMIRQPGSPRTKIDYSYLLNEMRKE